MQTEKYVRKPFVVEAVQVTEENLEQVAEWVPGAHVRTQKVNGEDRRYVKIKVKGSQNERQTKAFAGDWVLYASEPEGFKVYTKNAFERTFEPVFKQGLQFSDPGLMGLPVPSEPVGVGTES